MKEKTMQKLLLLISLLTLIAFLSSSCVTVKRSHSKTMYAKRAAFIKSHGEPRNEFFDRKCPNVFR